MKIGDKIICIKDYYNEGSIVFLQNRYYIVRDIEIYKKQTLIKVDDFYFTIDAISDSQFGKYFQTIAEFRESRINEILE
jgi:hypothetical protein